LASIEQDLGNAGAASDWTVAANIAGDYVMVLFNPATGCFYAGSVPVGTAAQPGIAPIGPTRGNEVINVFDFLDTNTFTTLALAAVPGYRRQIDWRRPVQCFLDRFRQTVMAAGQGFVGFDLVAQPTDGPNGVAWEFTGQAAVTMRFVDRLYRDMRFEQDAALLLGQIRRAQQLAPFTDGQGLVASTMDDGDVLPPIEQCLSTPYQCIPERVGLAATTWAIFAERSLNPLGTPLPSGPAPPIPLIPSVVSLSGFGLIALIGIAMVLRLRRRRTD
jgi:hypothetical protein